MFTVFNEFVKSENSGNSILNGVRLDVELSGSDSTAFLEHVVIEQVDPVAC